MADLILYQPAPAPQVDTEDFKRYVFTEFVKVSNAITQAVDTPLGGLVDASTGGTQSVATATADVVDQFDTVAQEDGIGVDTTLHFTTYQDGVYEYSFNAVIAGDANNLTVFFDVYADGAAAPIAHTADFVKQSGDFVSVSGNWKVRLSRGQVVDLRISHDSGGTRIITYKALSAQMLKVGI